MKRLKNNFGGLVLMLTIAFCISISADDKGSKVKKQEITTNATKAITVINHGRPGCTTNPGLRDIKKYIATDKPNYCIIWFGINDALNSKSLVPLDKYRENIEKMIRMAQESGIEKPILSTLHPVITEYVKQRHPSHPQLDNLQEYLEKYDQVIRETASKMNLPVLDVRKIIIDNGGAEDTEQSLIFCEKNHGGRDGVHMNAQAYRLIAEEACRLLKEQNIIDGAVVDCFGDSLTYGVKVRTKEKDNSYPAILNQLLVKK